MKFDYDITTNFIITTGTYCLDAGDIDVNRIKLLIRCDKNSFITRVILIKDDYNYQYIFTIIEYYGSIVRKRLTKRSAIRLIQKGLSRRCNTVVITDDIILEAKKEMIYEFNLS